MSAEPASTITVCDTKPGLVAAFAEELHYVATSLGRDVEIHAFEETMKSQ